MLLRLQVGVYKPRVICGGLPSFHRGRAPLALKIKEKTWAGCNCLRMTGRHLQLHCFCLDTGDDLPGACLPTLD
eukprot:1158946-Pelagomonas_calceolata.AAC.1